MTQQCETAGDEMRGVADDERPSVDAADHLVLREPVDHAVSEEERAEDLQRQLDKARQSEARLASLEVKFTELQHNFNTVSSQLAETTDQLRKATDLISNQGAVIKHMESMLLEKGGALCQP